MDVTKSGKRHSTYKVSMKESSDVEYVVYHTFVTFSCDDTIVSLEIDENALQYSTILFNSFRPCPRVQSLGSPHWPPGFRRGFSGKKDERTRTPFQAHPGNGGPPKRLVGPSLKDRRSVLSISFDTDHLLDMFCCRMMILCDLRIMMDLDASHVKQHRLRTTTVFSNLTVSEVARVRSPQSRQSRTNPFEDFFFFFFCCMTT